MDLVTFGKPPAPVKVMSTAHLSAISNSLASPAYRAKIVARAVSKEELGENFLKTSIFKWDADHLGAGPLYDQAGDAYGIVEDYDQAQRCYTQAMKSYEAVGLLSSSAMVASKASATASSQGDVTKACKLLVTSAELWGLNGEVSKFAEVLAKAAKMYETTTNAGDKAEAIRLYTKSIDIQYKPSMNESQIKQLAPPIIEILRNLFLLLVREKMHTEALTLTDIMINVFIAFGLESSLCKTMIAVTLLNLTLGDFVKAKNVYLNEHLNNKQFIRSKECELTDLFITAYSNDDIVSFDKAKASYYLNSNLDPEIRRLALDLSLISAEGLCDGDVDENVDLS